MEDFNDFPIHGLLPKKETEALKFLSKYPNYDGRGVIIAVLDTGVDPGAPGLQKTSDGRPKIVDVIDATGSGDVDISCVKEVNKDGYIIGLSERKLIIPQTWSNPSGKYHVGLKAAFDLYPSSLKDRMKKERKEKLWSKSHELALAQAQKSINDLNNNDSSKTDKSFESNLVKEDLQVQYDIIKDLENKIKDCGPVYDCIVWCDSDGVWRCCIDTSEKGVLDECQVLTNFKDSFKYGTFTHLDMLNYAIKIIPEENVLQIVTDSGSHGTHVASIAAGFYEDNIELNGIAPGAQILSIKIGDTRIGGMETNYAVVNAMQYILEYKCHLVNYSFGEPISYCNTGPALTAFEELVEKHGIIACISAGNNGPGICTVGAPGAYSNSVISVGAYVSTEMLKAEHSVIGKNGKSMMFTWSSRGPTIDGHTGVTVCAPGGAFASVPHWTLRGTQLMNGTSMASPNCCGSIALILSGLIDNQIEYFPYGIQRALENTAVKVADELGSGSGLIQIDKAYDYIINSSNDILNKIQFEFKCGPKSTRGLFIKLNENYDNTKVFDYLITVEPKFFIQYEDKNKFFKTQNDKISFKMRLALTCDEHWIEVPKHIYMVNSSKQFVARIRVDDLDEGKVYYTQIKAYDVENPNKSCIFKIPITIIKPLTLRENVHKNYEIEFKNVNFQQGQIERHFFHVPNGSTHAEINLKCDENVNRDHAPLFYVQTFTFDDYHSYDDTRKDEIYRLNTLNSFKYIFKCQSNKIVQVCICKNWSNIGQINADYTVKFYGLSPLSNSPKINCLSGEPCRIDITGLQKVEECEPSITWKYHLQPLRSNEHTIELYRARYAELKSIYQLILTYNFHQTKSGEICFESPLLSNILYESEYQSIFWILYDSNKRYLLSGDAFPAHYKYAKTIDKGDYTIRLYIRHEKFETLERLKSLVLYARHSISNVPQDIYTSYAALIRGSKKSNISEKILKGQQITLFLDSIVDEKLPKGVAPGHFLKGELNLYSDSQINKIDNHEIIYEINDYSAKKNDKLSASKVNDENKEKKSEDEKLNEAIRDLKVSWLLKSTDLFEKLINDHPDHIPVYINRIKYLENQLSLNTDNANQKQDYLSQIIDLSKTALSKINQNDLFNFFGIKKHETANEELKKEMESQRNWVIDLLCYQGIAMAEKNLIESANEYVDELKSIYKSLQKWIDINDEKVSKFLLKFCLSGKFYGRALKILFKQNDDKATLTNDKTIIEVLKQLKLNYAIYFYENDLILKYPKSFTKY